MLKYETMNEERKKQFRKKAFILSSIYLFFCLFINSFNNSAEREFSYEKNPNYNSEIDNEYAYYKNRNVYILGKETFEEIEKNQNDIYLLDYRNVLNSNVQIYDSNLIHDKEDMYNILAILLEYNKEFPNDRWNRSIDGMYLEWYWHYVFFDNSILMERSCNVDLDTRDAFFFEDYLVKKLLLK